MKREPPPPTSLHITFPSSRADTLMPNEVAAFGNQRCPPPRQPPGKPANSAATRHKWARGKGALPGSLVAAADPTTTFSGRHIFVQLTVTNNGSASGALRGRPTGPRCRSQACSRKPGCTEWNQTKPCPFKANLQVELGGHSPVPLRKALGAEPLKSTLHSYMLVWSHGLR